MKKFKYKVDQFNDMVNFNSALQEYGNEGWELVSTFTDKISNSNVIIFAVFKQEY